MRRIILDAEKMTSLPVLHKYLQKALALPEHYGMNLDALADCLGEMAVETELVVPAKVQEEAYLGWYGEQLLAVFRDAAEENEKPAPGN